MSTDLRFSVPAVAIAGICALAAVARAATAATPPPRPAASPAVDAEIAREVAASEAEWRKATTEHFPSDHWSERDDFGGLEYQRDEKLSAKHNVRLEDVIRAVDDDLHANPVHDPTAPDPRAARAVPCKPRPFYD